MSDSTLTYAVHTATRQGVTRDLPHGPEDLQWVAKIPEIAYPEPLGAEFFEPAGHRLEVIEAGFTDTACTTSLWVPDLR
jgi:hypothetical protein